MHESTHEAAPRRDRRRAASAVHLVDGLPTTWQALAFDLLFPPGSSGGGAEDRPPAAAGTRSELARTA